jgi:hypothetical protein
MNEQEVIAIAKAKYMSGESDKFTEYSRHNKNFRFKDERSESDLCFSFVYRDWSISYEADDYWCDMCGLFDDIDNDLLKILSHDDLLEIIQSIVGLVDPISDESCASIEDMNYDEPDYEFAYHNFYENLSIYIFSLVGCFSDPQIAIMDGLIEKTSKTLARLYGHMGYRCELEAAA